MQLRDGIHDARAKGLSIETLCRPHPLRVRQLCLPLAKNPDRPACGFH
jgi:hypothetical protein